MGSGACCGKGSLEVNNNDAKTEEQNNSHDFTLFQVKGKLIIRSFVESGAFGDVSKVETDETNEIYILKKSSLNLTKNVKTLVIEQDILQKCHHPNIISIKEAFKDRNINSFNIIEEYAKGGTLRQQINEKKNIEENTLIFWLIQICLALSYLHKKKIYHRDLKPENIFLTGTQLIKIGDFGLAKENKSLTDLKRKMTTKVGTWNYMAPEINSGKYNEKVDIYSLGKTFNDFFQFNNNYSKELINLVNNFMEIEPSKRQSSDQILKSPIIKEGMKSFLKKNNYENSLAKLIMENINIKNNKYSKDGGEDIFIQDIKNERKRLIKDLHYKYNEEEDSKYLDIIMCIIKKKLYE